MIIMIRCSSNLMYMNVYILAEIVFSLNEVFTEPSGKSLLSTKLSKRSKTL